MPSPVGVQLVANGEALLKATGTSFRTIREQARDAARGIAGDTAGAIELGFKDGLRGVERDYRATIKSMEDLSRTARVTNGVVQFDRSAQNAELQTARENLAIQQRLAAALDRVAAEQGENAVAARIQAAASAAAVQQAEEQVRVLERQAMMLDRVQNELGQTGGATKRYNQLTGEARQGAQQLSYNLADIASGWAAGIPPMQIFAQQGTQVVQAIQLMTTKTGGFIGFLAGPWGLAITSAVTVLGSLIYNMREGADASTDLKLKIDIQKNSYEALIKAVREYNEAQQDSAALTKLATAEAKKQAIEAINLAKAQLAATQAKYLDQQGASQGSTAIQFGLSSEIRANQRRLAELQKELREIEKGLANQYVEGRLKKETEITNRIGAQLIELEASYDKGTVSVKKYREERERLLKLQEKELEAYRAAKREASGSRAAGAASRDARLGDMVALIKQLFPGARITSTDSGRHTKGSDHYAGRAIDFVPGGGMGKYSTAEVERILEEAGVDIRRNARGTKQLFGPGRSAKNAGDHDDHFHVAWKGSPDPERAAEAQARQAEQAARAAEELARQISNATEQSTALRGQFEPLPGDIVRANNALIDVQQEIAKNQALLKKDGLGADQAKELRAAITDLERTRDTLIPQSLTKPMTDELSAMRQAIDGQQLLIEGRRGEYDQMQDTVDLARLLGAESVSQLGTIIEQRGITADQLKIYYQQQQVLRQQTIEIQRRQEEEQKLLRVVDDVASTAKGAIYDFYDGRGLGAAKNFFKGLFDIQKQAMTEDTYKLIFGDAFENQKLKILGLDKVDTAGRDMAAAIDKTIDPILALGEAAAIAAGRMGGIPSNDNGAVTTPADIVVSARRSAQTELRSTIEQLGNKLLGPKLTEKLKGAFSGALQGAAYGQAASGVLRSLGMKQSGTGAAIGGAIGNFLPIPGGSLIGGLIGGTIGGLFKKTPKGSSTITDVSQQGVYSGSSKLREAVSGLAAGVQGSLAQIADALGGETGGFSVSIGQRKKKFTVDPTGAGRTKGAGVLSFATEEEAVMAALRDALSDGAIKGISAASQRILQKGKDIDKAIEKASLIESIPKLLKARTNPVAAALDDLNEKWAKTVAALKEGAATAAQFADAQKLYELERQDILAAANDNLKEFINGLNFGPNSGLSLRDQSANARAQLQPYLAAIQSGNIEGIDRDKYLAAADSFLQISRQLNGSGAGYFATVDELRNATQSLLDQSEKGAAGSAAKDPFAEATAKATQSAANILADQTDLLIDIRNGLQALGYSGGGGGFIGTDRRFVSNR